MVDEKRARSRPLIRAADTAAIEAGAVAAGTKQQQDQKNPEQDAATLKQAGNGKTQDLSNHPRLVNRRGSPG